MKENKKIPPATVKRLPLYLQCLDLLNEDIEFSTKILIGADGANSRIRKKLNYKHNSDWHKAIAIRAYIDSPNYLEIFKERTLMFEINVSADKGYAWAFPSKGNLLNIGIGVPVSIFKKDKLDINTVSYTHLTLPTNREV